jgi:hypothetical protein
MQVSNFCWITDHADLGLLGFISPSRQKAEWYLKVDHDRFHPLSLQLIFRFDRTIRLHIVQDTDSVVK